MDILTATPDRLRMVEACARGAVETYHTLTGATHLSALLALVQVHAVDARTAFAGYEPLRPHIARMFRALADGIESESAEHWAQEAGDALFEITTQILQLANGLDAANPQA